jgi:alkylation response protein AidB-like acyl-CoA dehydrogenase
MPREDCEILDTWYSAGLRGTGSHDFIVKDVLVPAERSFSLMTARSPYDAPLYRAGILSVFPYSVAAVALGIARGALDALEDLAAGKVPTFSFATLRDKPAVQHQVAEAEALYRSARAFLYEAADSIWDSMVAGEPLTDEQEAVTHLACTNAGAASARAVDTVYTLGGATSVYATSRLERCLRDVHVVTQHIGVSFQWYERTGKYFLGQPFQQFG